MKINPIPCVKGRDGAMTRDMTVRQFYEHLQSEVLEAHREAVRSEIVGIGEYEEQTELGDVITLALSWLVYKRGLDEEKLTLLFRRIGVKNRERGYHE